MPSSSPLRLRPRVSSGGPGRQTSETEDHALTVHSLGAIHMHAQSRYSLCNEDGDWVEIGRVYALVR